MNGQDNLRTSTAHPENRMRTYLKKKMEFEQIFRNFGVKTKILARSIEFDLSFGFVNQKPFSNGHPAYEKWFI